MRERVREIGREGERERDRGGGKGKGRDRFLRLSSAPMMLEV